VFYQIRFVCSPTSVTVPWAYMCYVCPSKTQSYLRTSLWSSGKRQHPLCERSFHTWVRNPDGGSLWTIMKFNSFDFYLSNHKKKHKATLYFHIIRERKVFGGCHFLGCLLVSCDLIQSLEKKIACQIENWWLSCKLQSIYSCNNLGI
jgi:hypothetical protein